MLNVIVLSHIQARYVQSFIMMNDIMQSVTFKPSLLGFIMMNDVRVSHIQPHYAESHMQACYVECHYDECYYAESHTSLFCRLSLCLIS